MRGVKDPTFPRRAEPEITFRQRFGIHVLTLVKRRRLLLYLFSWLKSPWVGGRGRGTGAHPLAVDEDHRDESVTVRRWGLLRSLESLRRALTR